MTWCMLRFTPPKARALIAQAMSDHLLECRPDSHHLRATQLALNTVLSTVSLSFCLPSFDHAHVYACLMIKSFFNLRIN